MNNVWRFILCLAFCALPMTAKAQFGGLDAPTPAPPTLWRIDPTVKPDYSPIVVGDAAMKRGIAKVVALLDKPLAELEIDERPLSEAINLLRKKTGLRIVVDERALADASIGMDTLIRCSESDATLRTVLESLLDPHGLAWHPGGEGIIITTKEERDTQSLVVIYPVADLVAGPEGADFDTLVQTISSCIHPNDWDAAGGNQIIIVDAKVGALIIDKPWYMHEGVEQLLSGLRKAKERQGIQGLRGHSDARPAKVQLEKSAKEIRQP